MEPREPERFLVSSISIETDDCILWPYGKCRGYGVLKLGSRVVQAHRGVCLLVYGEPNMERAHAAHSCDTPACINKRHLRWATPKGNAEDRLAHGVVHRGQAAGSNLTEENVVAIYADPRSDRTISRTYGCSKGTVYNIKRGISWAWLTNHSEAA